MRTTTFRIRRGILAAGVLLTAACAGGGDPGDVPLPTHYVRVLGVVEDNAGDPVPRVSAQLVPDSGFSFARRTTDDDGRYVLTADARFSATPAPDSVTLKLRFYPTEGRHRDSLLLELPVRMRVVPVAEPEAPATRNVTIELP